MLIFKIKESLSIILLNFNYKKKILFGELLLEVIF